MWALQILASLALTVIIECGLFAIFTRRKKFVYYDFLCNLLTNPLLNVMVALGCTFFGVELYYIFLIPLEVIAVIVEACVLKYLCDFSFKRAFVISLILNLASFSIGLIFF